MTTDATGLDQGGVWAPGRRLLTVGLILLITFVAAEALAVATVMPTVEQDLGDLGLYGWVFSGFFLGSLLGIVVAGRASDRMRPVIPFAVGLALFLLGLIIAGAAGSMPVLVAARVLQGIGAGALPTVAYVAIGREYPPAARPRMFALLSTAWVVPSLVGPAAAAVVGEQFGWRWVFLGLIPLVTVCGVGVMGSVARIAAPQASSAASGGKADLRDALVLTLGAGLTLWGLERAQPVLAVIVTAVGLMLLVPAFRRLTPAGTLSARAGLPAAVLIRGVLTFAFFGADAFVPLGLTSVRGTTTLFASLAITVCSLTWTAGSWTQERFIARRGPRPLVRTGFALVGTGVVLMIVTLVPGVPVGLGVVAWGVAGMGIGMAYSPLSVTALAEAGAGQEGSATASLQLSDVLGIALGTGIGGVVVATGDRAGWSPRPALLIVMGLSLAVSLVGMSLVGRLPHRVIPVEGAARRPIDEILAGAAEQPPMPAEADRASPNPHI
ncbi:MAG TPA: MFS transporter [Acidimicrobiales bacterium]